MKAFRLAHEKALTQLKDPFDVQAKQGRWNSEGWRVAYASEHPALAALEMLGYWDDYASMNGYHLLVAEFPENLVEDAGHVDPFNDQITRAFGNQWLQEERSAILKVRSVVMPHSFNLLINAAHPSFSQLSTQNLGAFTYDARIHRMIELAKQ